LTSPSATRAKRTGSANSVKASTICAASTTAPRSPRWPPWRQVATRPTTFSNRARGSFGRACCRNGTRAASRARRPPPNS
jgi:hypothetical protein